MTSPSIASHLALPLVSAFAGAQSLWWPAASSAAPKVVLLFIPGNPGISSYYIDFLQSIYTAQSLSGASIEILSVSHRGHALLPIVGDNPIWGSNVLNANQARKGYGTSLQDQVRHKVAALDVVRKMYPDREKTKIVLVGHSIGAWMALELLKKRPEDISGIHLLFPTLAWIGRTPSARRLQFLVHPITTSLLLTLPLFFLSLLPLFLLTRLISLITRQPNSSALATAELLTTPGALRNALKMARQEFKTLQGVEASTTDAVRSFVSRDKAAKDRGYIRSYWAAGESDTWTPEWIRSQVETELGLQRVQLPSSLQLESSNLPRPKARTRMRSFSMSEYRSSPGSVPDLRNAKAIRKPNGEIVIEAQVADPSSDSSEDDDETATSERAARYHLGKNNATTTHCRVGMPHAFTIHHAEDMAQIVAHWIAHDQVK